MKQFEEEELRNLMEESAIISELTEKINSAIRKEDEVVVSVSGYFTALHKGHLELFKSAKKLGTKLVVIINNDAQQINKKGKLIQHAEHIKEIVEEFKVVDDVVISIDNDETVCETLKLVRPDVFANGGDRTSDNVPEQDVAFKIGCKMVYGIGGDKINSSSDILEKEETRRG